MSDIQKPKGEALLYRRDTWNVVFYRDGKRKFKSLSTQDHDIATFRRDLFFQDVETKPRKEYGDEDKYIYRVPRYYVKVGKKLLGRFEKKSEAREVRDNYLEKQNEN